MTKRLSFDLLEHILTKEQPQSSNAKQYALLKKALSSILREQLSEKQRKMLLLYFYEQKSMPEISDMLHVNKSTVSRTINRGITNIQKYLRYFPLI